MTLRTGDVACPGRPGVRVPAFASGTEAVRHLNDHVLTHPECRGWALVLPDHAWLLDSPDADARWRYATEAERTGGDSAQLLFDQYRAAVDLDATSAGTLGWFLHRGAVTVALGTCGILIVVDRDLLRSAFLPAQGDPERVRRAKEDRSLASPAGSLPREGRGRWRSAYRSLHPRDERRKEEIEDCWGPAERLYYRVFRPAVQFVRCAVYDASGLLGRPMRDYGRLRRCLPRMSRLRLEDWLARRHELGISDAEEMRT